ncbi:MAG: cytochrome c [Magnetococcales bacterium]|nr:cytochrome c [Magnetococcales bacterium]
MVRWTFALALGLWLAVFATLRLFIIPPAPVSVLTIYMTLVTVAILLFVMANEARWQGFLAPPRAVFAGRVSRPVQVTVLAGLPILVGFVAHLRLTPTWDAPFEPRVVHPQPPSSFTIQGRRIELAALTNPLRSDPAALDQRIAEGKTIYYRNCFFCHGDALAGDGPFAQVFRPLPANFRDVGTISMLQESFVFWRVATGGPGLPKGATPWHSAMPVWQQFLAEEEIWKAILFIYAGSGSTPRTWEEGTADVNRH